MYNQKTPSENMNKGWLKPKGEKNMKKILSVLLLALISMSVVFAGGASDSSSANAEVTTLKLANWDTSTMPFIPAVIEAFESENPDIKVEVIDIPSAEYVTKLNVMLNGGSDLDLFFAKEADKTKAFYDKGQLANLSSYIEAAGIDMSTYGGTDANFIYDGSVYGMPVRTDKYVLYYNKDMFDAAGVPYPDNDMTWSEFEEIAAKITSGSGASKKYGAFIHSWQACVQNWAVQDGKNTIMSGNYEMFKPYYEMVLRMQEAGSIMDYATIKSSGIHYSDPFLQGNVGMLPMGSWFMATIIQRVEKGESSVNWGVAVIPHADDVENGYTVGATTPICINNASKNKDAAWKFAEFISGPKGAEIYASYGQIPSLSGEKYMEILSTMPGMPENVLDGLYSVNVSPDRPAMDHVTEVDQMLGQEHSLIMLGEVSVDEGIATMNERLAEILK